MRSFSTFAFTFTFCCFIFKQFDHACFVFAFIVVVVVIAIVDIIAVACIVAVARTVVVVVVAGSCCSFGILVCKQLVVISSKKFCAAKAKKLSSVKCVIEEGKQNERYRCRFRKMLRKRHGVTTAATSGTIDEPLARCSDLGANPEPSMAAVAVPAHNNCAHLWLCREKMNCGKRKLHSWRESVPPKIQDKNFPCCVTAASKRYKGQ